MKRERNHARFDHLSARNRRILASDEISGTMRSEDFAVDCDDQGMECVDTHVHCELSEVLNHNPNMELLLRLLSFEPYISQNGSSSSGNKREALLGVHISTYDCGRLATVVCISHKIADGASVATLLASWSLISRRCHSSATDDGDLADGTARELPAGFKRQTEMRNHGKVACRMFVFSKSDITALRDKAASAGGGSVGKHYYPTRVNVVSGLIWQPSFK